MIVKTVCSLFIWTLVFSLVFACNNKKPVVVKSVADQATRAFHKDSSKLLRIDTARLALKKDPVCYMPLWTGIKDTCTYKGKLYGFCSKDCKNDFLKSPAEYAVK